MMAQTGLQHRGFTLLEVLVALSIVAIALSAGLQSAAALTRWSERQATQWLAGLCATNAMVATSLQPALAQPGSRTWPCAQGAQRFEVRLTSTPTSNPRFNKVVAEVVSSGPASNTGVLMVLSTIQETH